MVVLLFLDIFQSRVDAFASTNRNLLLQKSPDYQAKSPQNTEVAM